MGNMVLASFDVLCGQIIRLIYRLDLNDFWPPKSDKLEFYINNNKIANAWSYS